MGISRSFRWLTMVLFVVLLGSLLVPGTGGVAAAQTSTVPDLGDAPDNTNAAGAAMLAYPGVPARFPTSLLPVAQPPGPRHINAGLMYYLGNSISREAQADMGADQDGINNIVPAADIADNDEGDDGLILPGNLAHCTRIQLRYRVRVTALATGPVKAYVNLWSDWNRDGSWMPASNMVCPGIGAAAEWAVQNHVIVLPGPGSYLLSTPPIVVWNNMPASDMWVRLGLSNTLAPAPDGRGPAASYAKGETEDYRLEGTPPPPLVPPDLDIAPTPLTGQPPVSQPPDITVPGGKLKEVDVVHIGGSSGGPKMPLIVSAVGTGATVRLSSWSVPFGMQAPKLLHNSPNIVGYDVKLYALTPDVSPDLTYSLLVSAVRDTQQNLWLTTWRLKDDGTFVQVGKRGYGSNANVHVMAYAIAHRPLFMQTQTISSFQVVTPIVTSGGAMRLISWSVNPTTGAINGLQDSGNWGNPKAGTTVDAARLNGDSWTGPYYTVSYRNTAGNLATTFWEVNAAGTPTPRGSGASGVDIRGDSIVKVAVQDMAIAPLTGTGFVSAHTSTSQSRVSSWDNQPVFCSGDGGCVLSPHFISDNGADLNPGSGIGLSLPSIASERALLVDALGATDLDDTETLFQKGDTTPQGVASIRKVMVLMIALEAVANGEVALDDLVEVSETAANHPGSSMGLEAGEVQSLRNLLYGMMMVSGGDATQAIIEYIGAEIGGTAATFVARMVARANDIDMNDTLYCGTGGYCYSTTEDQVALWLAASKTPLFHEFAGKEQYDACGQTDDNPNKCYFMTKNVSQLYPGVESHKTGGGGFDCAGGTSNTTPRCASQGCLSIQATRLNRSLVLNELHSTSAQTAPDRWNDAYDLLDYGFRQLFTPDFRGNSGPQGGPALDFAIDNIGDTQFVSAVLTPGGALKLCNWQVVAGIGQIEQLACVERAYTDLPGGSQQVSPQRIDILRLSTLESEGDYLSGHLESGNLMLRAWRVAERP